MVYKKRANTWIDPIVNIVASIFIAFFVLIIFSGSLLAQNKNLTSSNKKAVKYYNQAVSFYNYHEFNNAIVSINKSLKYDKTFVEAWLLLGDSYTEMKSIPNAIQAYESGINVDSLFYSGTYYMLGNLYYSIGEYKKALHNYQFMASLPNVSKSLLPFLNSKISFTKKAIQLIENPVTDTIYNVGLPVNSVNDEYINYVNTDTNFIMFTRRERLVNSSLKRPVYKEKVLFSDKNNSLWDKPLPVNLPWQNDLNMGSLNLSVDGKSMFFTGCYWQIGQGSCDLYVSHSIGDTWQAPVSLGNAINTGSWESQPIISSDNKKLYFASKRSGGKGGSDIWMSVKLNNNTWSPPVNLGDSINTDKDEMSPFLHADGRTLVFASKGHPGLGGYDLFISKQDELGRWSLAQNIGYPTNSRFNEINIFMSIDGDYSMISSDRDGGFGGMDIYQFKNYKNLLPEKVMYIKGLIVNKLTKKPLKAKIQITNLNTGKIINTTFSDSIVGSFLLVVYPGVDYAFNISKNGYAFLSETVSVNDTIKSNVINKTFMMQAFVPGNQIVMNNVFFKFNDFELLPSSHVELNKLVELLKSHTNYSIEIIGHTDNLGSDEYNTQLSLKRAESVGNYLVNNGIQQSRLFYKGMGSSLPVAVNDTDKGRAKNRRTEIIIK